MSINTEITRIDGAKSSIKTAIEGKGVTVPSATKIDGMAAYISQIPTGGGTPYAIISVTYPSGSVCTCTKGSTVLTAEDTSGRFNFGVPEAGEWTLYCTDGDSEATIYVTVSEQYSVVNAQLTYAANPVLNNNKWATISVTAAEGEAQNYWAVGDRKAITLNGQIGIGLTLENYVTYVYIIGFNHNGATNTIDFGTFKTALIGGTDTCLVDNGYNAEHPNSDKYFSYNHSAATAQGGWKNCDLRYDILGSTDVKRADATSVAITNPVANTLMAALPSELRSVLKPISVYTDNVGATNIKANVTASIDYLPLLAEFEIFGQITYANQYERDYQSQYSYYANGNLKTKYRHDMTNTSSIWWERSPYNAYLISVCMVAPAGNPYVGYTPYSYGLSPIFRV